MHTIQQCRPEQMVENFTFWPWAKNKACPVLEATSARAYARREFLLSGGLEIEAKEREEHSYVSFPTIWDWGHTASHSANGERQLKVSFVLTKSRPDEESMLCSHSGEEKHSTAQGGGCRTGCSCQGAAWAAELKEYLNTALRHRV